MENEKKMTGYPSIDKPWLKYCTEEAINTPLPECTMYEHIFNVNQDNLDRIVINYYGRNISYKKFFEDIDYVAGSLENIGIKEGDIVTVCMINSPETITLMFALNKIGAVANMIYGVSTPDEIKKYLLDTNSSIVFTLDMFQEKFVEIINEVKINKVIVANLTQSMSVANRIGARMLKGMKPKVLPKDKRFISWKDFMKNNMRSTTTSHNPDVAAVITYTGGTTGGSKGVMLSNKAVVSVAWQYCRKDSPMRRESTWVQVLPLFIAYGVTCSLMFPLTIGMTMIVRIPMTDSIANLCKKFKPNHIMYGPAYWEAFADDNANLDLSYFVDPTTGGDTLPANTENKINKYFEEHGCPYKIMNGYGMTEVGAAVSVNFKNAYEFGSVGTPLVKNVISAFDIETGKELKYGEEGEICIHTPSMMMGYINNPEETANIMKKHEDGLMWIHSGDLGFISENGFVHISGRLKRCMLCIANGVQKKVFSLDIEKALQLHEKVDRCAVVPVPDKTINEAPVAYIIPKKEFADVNLEDELREHCEKHLQDVYRPIKYIFIDKFPLTKVGKVDYTTLEKRAKDVNNK